MFQSANLFIDIGHSFIKWRVQNSTIKINSVNDFCVKSLPKSNNVWLSCVAYDNIAKDIYNSFNNVFNIKTIKKFKNINIAYEDPSKMGVDRFLAILAANNYHFQKNLLIIDIGSAITVDVVDKNGQHQGGLIMPGLRALRNSFKKFAINSDLIVPLGLKTNTKESWLAGTEGMIIASIKEQIDIFLNNYQKGEIIFTGAGANVIAKYINKKITVYNNLVLDGIEYYVNNIS